MCATCDGEYRDEADRRYHAQPNACFERGPSLCLADNGEPPRAAESEPAGAPAESPGAAVDSRTLNLAQTAAASDALIARCVELLRAGRILAVKGLGGWHLTCDACNQQAVAELRARKHRPTKPLAIMVPTLEAAREFCEISAEEEALLASHARPIVLLALTANPLAPGICQPLPCVGVMLPATPVQHLLLRAFGGPLVMTSGNRGGEPIVAADSDAFAALGNIADAFLGNNRRIVARYDDSVVRVTNKRTVTIRRARGLAPSPLFVPAPRQAAEPTGSTNPTPASAKSAPTIFAAGPEQKATLCFLRDGRAFVSQHLGDLETAGAFAAYEEAYERYRFLFSMKPQVVACDLHPEYLSSKWARAMAAAAGLPLVEVQHHHAHVASVMGEHGLDEPVSGVALDGSGYGSDDTILCCVILVAVRARFERAWHLPTFALPGGAAAIKNPARVGFSLLTEFGELENPQFAAFLEGLPERRTLEVMLQRGLNSPRTSSLGRLFDGTAALLGLATRAGYDGEPACLLEAAALASQPPAALEFHQKVAGIIIRECVELAHARGLGKVALSGGCLVNRLLSTMLAEGLQQEGLRVYTNIELPPNDGCIAYGQAIVAAAQLEAGLTQAPPA